MSIAGNDSEGLQLRITAITSRIDVASPRILRATDGWRLYAHGRNQTKLVDSVLAQAEAVRGILGDFADVAATEAHLRTVLKPAT